MKQTSSIPEKRQRLLALLKDLSWTRGEVTLASGRTSNFYIDTKQTSLNAEGGLLVGELVFAHIQRLRAEGMTIAAVGGITLGADPISTAAAVVAQQHGEPAHAFIIRKEPKGHGTGMWVEGLRNVPTGTPVLIVEDVVTTGGSTLKAINRAKESGLRPVAILALVDRLEGGRAALEATGIPFASLFTKDDFFAA